MLTISRENCLQIHPNQEKSAQTLLVVTYHPILPPFHVITKRHHSTLHTLEQRQRAVPLPSLIGFHNQRNLRDLLVWASLSVSSQVPPGNCPCRAAGCKLCPIFTAIDELTIVRSRWEDCKKNMNNFSILHMIVTQAMQINWQRKCAYYTRNSDSCNNGKYSKLNNRPLSKAYRRVLFVFQHLLTPSAM